MRKPIISFLLWLSIGLIIVFAVHLSILGFLKIPLFNQYIVFTYGLNFLMASAIYVLILRLRKKYNDSLGFIYMGGSFLKFILYFLLIHPLYKADGAIEKSEAFAFFIPYLYCLIAETRALIRLLNS